MKRSNVISYLLLIIASVCFISLPVFSSEHPWDSDDDNGGNTNLIDSLTIYGDDVIIRNRTEVVTEPVDNYTYSVFTVSTRVTFWIYNNFVSPRIDKTVKPYQNYSPKRGDYRSSDIMR